MAQRQWTRDELILAFNLYCKTPFGRIHYRNTDIIALAKLIGRTPASVSWKLANFARLDPEIQSRKLSGATHGAKGEEDIWNEFSGNWSKLAYESERLLAAMQNRELAPPEEAAIREGKTKESIVRVRLNQAFFRAAVLAAYDSKCCITGLAVGELLNASHIVPWSVDTPNRVNPRNGLCLNAIHDRAFDCGLITVTTEYKVRVSAKLGRYSDDAVCRSWLKRYEGRAIRLPSRFLPQREFLEYHNRYIYRDSG